MLIETVNCILGVREKPEHEMFNLSVYKTGIEAVPVTEVMIHQAVNGLDSVWMVSPASSYEISRADEFARLQGKYRAEVLAQCYPTAATPFPRTIADLGLEPEQMDPTPPRAPVVSSAPEPRHPGAPEPRVEEPFEVPAAYTPPAKAEQPDAKAAEKAEKARIRARLDEIGYAMPFGNFGLERLRQMLAEAEAKAA